MFEIWVGCFYVLVVLSSIAYEVGVWRGIMRVHIFDRPKVRRTFHWKHSNGLILALWASVMAMAALGTSLDNASYLFKCSYLLSAAAFVWSVGSWFTADALHRMGHKSRRQRRGLDPYSRPKYLVIKYGGLVLIAVVFVLFAELVAALALRKELQSLAGRLLPASDEMPSGACGRNLRDDEIVVFLGHGDAIRTNKFPEVIIVSKRFGPILSVDRSEDGTISVLLEIRGKDGRIVTEFTQDGFVVNPNNVLQMKREDRSSLVIVDEYGREVINARYLNRHAFRLNGTINYGDGQIPIALPNLVNICYETTDFGGPDVGIP